MPQESQMTRHVERLTLIPVIESSGAKAFSTHGNRDKCRGFDDEKILSRHKHRLNIFKRTLDTLKHQHNKSGSFNKVTNDDYSYSDELKMHIAESTAYLQDFSDEETSEEESDPVAISPCSAKLGDVSTSHVSISLGKESMFVVPPVEVPCKYRRQDRQGGVLVAGHYVLFTNWAYKKQKSHMIRLGPLIERGEAQLNSVDMVDEDKSVGVYTGKIVEL